MRKLLLAALGLLAVTCAFAQSGQNSGILYATDFNAWTLPQGNTPTSGMIQWPSAAICTVSSNGYSFVAVKVGRPLTIVDVDPTKIETVTPTAVTTSGGSCTVTATMAYVHTSYSVHSGTAGLQEAIDYSSKLVGGSVVLLTPGWTVGGGQSGMITAATGSTSVSLLDERIATVCSYAWNGSVYASSGCGTGNASLGTTSLQTFAGPLAIPSVNNICNAYAQSGADAGAKIQACITSLGSSGGIVDATGLTGAQTISSLQVPGGITLKLGCGVYAVNAAINATNIGSFLGASIVGCKKTSEGIPGTVGTVLTGNTGAGSPVIDLTGSGNIQLSNFSIMLSTSTVGILEARSNTVAHTEKDKFDNITISAPSTPTANGNNGTVCDYNFGAEIHQYNHVTYSCDKPLVLTASNIYSLASPYATLATAGVTMTSVSVTGASDFYSTTAQCLTLSAASNINVDFGECAGNSVAGVYAIWADQAVFNTRITGSVELYDRLLRSGGQFVYSTVDVICASCGTVTGEPVIYLDTTTGENQAGNIAHSVFKPFYSPTVAHNFLQSAATAMADSVGWSMHIPTSGSVSVTPGAWMVGDIYYDSGTNSDNTVSAGIKATVHDKNGTSVIGGNLTTPGIVIGTGSALTDNQGTGAKVQHANGPFVAGNYMKYDSNGNAIDTGLNFGLPVTSINGANGNLTFNGAGVSCSGSTCTFSGGVSSINATAGAFTFTGSGVSCTGTTCTFSGGSGSNATSIQGNAVAAGTPTNGQTLVYNSTAAAYQPQSVGNVLPSASSNQQIVTVDTSGVGHANTPATMGTWDAVINGGADNTGAVDASTIFNNEFTSICSGSTPVRVHIPAGTYTVNSSITIAASSTTCKNIVVEGDGSGNTILQSTCSAHPYVFGWINSTSPAAEHFNGPTFRHFTVKNNSIQVGGVYPCAVGLEISQSALFKVEDVTPTGFAGQTYSTGTISSSGNAVTGVGTSFTSAMVHGWIQVTNGNTTTRSEVASVTDATHLTLFDSSFPTGNISAGTSYALPYGGDGLVCDPGAGISGSPFTQYATIKDVYASGNLVGIHAWGTNSGGCSRVQVSGNADYISPNPGSRVTDAVGIFLAHNSDTWEISAPINNTTACIVNDSGHANWINGAKCENGGSFAPVTTCNGGVGSQACTAAWEFSSDANSNGWNPLITNAYAYKVGNVNQFDNLAGFFNGTLLGPRDLSGQYTQHYSWPSSVTVDANGCPMNGSGVTGRITEYDCDYRAIAPNGPGFNVTTTTVSAVTVTGGNGNYYNQEATAAQAVIYTLPAPAKGSQFCFKNSYNGSAADTGTLELIVANTGTQSIIYNGASSASGFIQSSGAAGDAACVVGISSTQWEAYVQVGTWTLH